MPKICRTCHNEKPLDQFSPSKRNRGGLTNQCKDCTAAYVKTWRARTPEKQQNRYAKAKGYRQTTAFKVWQARYNESSKEERRRYHQRYGQEHAERIKQNAAAYYQKTRQERDDYNAEWRRKNPQRWTAIHKRWVANKKGARINDFTEDQWQAMLKHYHGRCAYCGKKSPDLTQDHITPLSKGGDHTLSNIVPACRSCNSKKNAGPILAPVQPLLL